MTTENNKVDIESDCDQNTNDDVSDFLNIINDDPISNYQLSSIDNKEAKTFNQEIHIFGYPFSKIKW